MQLSFKLRTVAPTGSAEPSELPPAVEPPSTPLVLPLDADEPAALAAARPLARALTNGTRSRIWVRRVHTVVGLVSALNLLVLIASGFLLQHRETLGLEERTVSRKLLPQQYRSQDGSAGVRADIVMADLHSGRLFGRSGALVMDGITLGWLVLLLSGLVMFTVGHWRRGNRPACNGDSTESCEGVGNGGHLQGG